MGSPGVEAAEFYEKAGVAALFIVLYITTVLFLIKQLVKAKEDAVKMVEKVTEKLAESTTAIQDNKAATVKLQELLTNYMAKQSEAMAYERGRRKRGDNE